MIHLEKDESDGRPIKWPGLNEFSLKILSAILLPIRVIKTLGCALPSQHILATFECENSTSRFALQRGPIWEHHPVHCTGTIHINGERSSYRRIVRYTSYF